MGWGPFSSHDHDDWHERPSKPIRYTQNEMKAIDAGQAAIIYSMIGFLALIALATYFLDPLCVVFGIMLLGYGSLCVGMMVEENTLRKLNRRLRKNKRSIR